MISLKSLRSQEPAFVDLLNYAALVRDGVVMGKDGSLIGGFLFRGPDVASATPEERNALTSRINSVLSRLGTGYTMHVDAIRYQSNHYPSPDLSFFPDEVTRRIDEERRRSFEEEGSHFESTYALFITYQPPRKNERQLTKMMFSGGGNKEEQGENKVIESFNETLSQIERELSSVITLSRLSLETKETCDPPLMVDHLYLLLTAASQEISTTFCFPPAVCTLIYSLGVMIFALE